jgi:DnaJ-class molecular chaperone
MASDHDDIDPTEASHAPQECMPCRGTGRVVSNLGGTAAKVTCPWCEGDGIRHHEIDAQARWSSTEGAEGADAPEADPPEAAEEAA